MLLFEMSKFDKFISLMYFFNGEINFPFKEVSSFKLRLPKSSVIVEKLTFFLYKMLKMKLVNFNVF